MTPEQARDVLFELTGEQGRAVERLIAELDRLRAQRVAVLAIHRQVWFGDASWPSPGHCEECERTDENGKTDYVPWPCETARALGVTELPNPDSDPAHLPSARCLAISTPTRKEGS